MTQFNITLTEEELHGLFLSNSRDEAVAKLLEKIFNEVLAAGNQRNYLALGQRHGRTTGDRNYKDPSFLFIYHFR